MCLILMWFCRITVTSVTRNNQVEISDDDDDDVSIKEKPSTSLQVGVDHRSKFGQFPMISVKPVITNDIDTITEETIFNKLDQTLLIDPSTYFNLPIDNNVSDLRLEPGVSFLAYCNNMDYHDTTIPVIIPKGYYLDSRGQFTLNEEVWELKCPKCKQAIQGNNPQGIGFSKCNVKVKYRDVNEETGSFNFQVDMSTFAFTQLSRPGQIKFNFVKFIVNIL